MKRQIGFLSKDEPGAQAKYSEHNGSFIKVADGKKGMSGILRSCKYSEGVYEFTFDKYIEYGPDELPIITEKKSSIEIVRGSSTVIPSSFSIEEYVEKEIAAIKNKTS
ncbi:hypothetical protein HN903_03075 [archaeon]|jgi:hypothetical protein|nr:hypothetical protein [archaeon]MBT6956059.1 hypothetical protein [archaeon]MBT7128712.1 hypothetical protein [archaeon]